MNDMAQPIATALRGLLRADQVSELASDKHAVAVDMWPLALLEARARLPRTLPLCVVWPESVEQVAAIVALCRARGVKIVPYGAGSGVVGGGWAEAGAV